jgi:hypothetical protein
MKRRALLLLPAVLPVWAQTTRERSQPVFRCGSEGRELSDRPCSPAAQASSVAFDQPSKADQQAARQRAAQDVKAADALAAERRREEAKATPRPSRLDGPSKATEPAKPVKKVKEVKAQKPKKKPLDPKPLSGQENS